jgi:very-short-patch-repair endonuclease
MAARKPPLYADVLNRARRLRRNSTDAEDFLWRLLRGRRFGGYKFRRQAPIGGYFVDFYCHEAAVVVELDGGGHNEEPQEEKDKKRDATLRKKGLNILRFWNHDVFQRTEAVLQSIWNAIGKSPSP